MKQLFLLILIPFLADLDVKNEMAGKYKSARNPIGSLDIKKKIYTCSVYPTESIVVNTFYNSLHSQTTLITENGNRVAVLYSPRTGAYQRKNNTANVIIYRIINTPNHDGKPYGIQVRMETETENFASIGWEDGDDTDFNDAVAQITIVKPLARRPGPFPVKKKK